MSIAGVAVGGQYDRAKEVREFDETKAGVKGLVDSGVAKIPRMFIHPPENLPEVSSCNNTDNDDLLQVPVIDFNGLETSQRRRTEIVDQIRKASETWGFFQIINHGVVPARLMDDLLDATQRFHEQPREAKMELYSRDATQRVKFYSNGDLYVSPAASWRDSLACNFLADDTLESLDPHQSLPRVCRKEIEEYMKCMKKVRVILCDLFSEALGLSREYLLRTECMQNVALVSQYYPACPEPHLTLGVPKHADLSSLTILLQDNVGGLQVLHQNHWVDVPPIPGALVANLGDFMQLISNDKFRSVKHRVLAGPVGPRLSAACFFTPSRTRAYGPLKELLSHNNPPIYRDILFHEYYAYYHSKGLGGTSALPHFKLQ